MRPNGLASAGGEDVGGAHRPQVRDQVRKAGKRTLSFRNPPRAGRSRRGSADRRRRVRRSADGCAGRAAAFPPPRPPHGPPQARQAAGAGEGGEEQPVGPQRAPDLDERARQVVDRVEQAGRDDQIEARLGEGKPILVGIGRSDLEAALAQPPARPAIRPENRARRRRSASPGRAARTARRRCGGGDSRRRRLAARRAGAAQPAQGAVERSVAWGYRLHAGRYSTGAASRCPPPDNLSGIGHGAKATMPLFAERMRWHASCCDARRCPFYASAWPCPTWPIKAPKANKCIASLKQLCE